MKKITLILTLLFIIFLNHHINAQLTENFDGATFPPTGWNIATGNGDYLNQSSEISDHTTGSDKFARYDTYNYSNGSTAYLISPRLLVSSTDKTFSFWTNYYHVGATTWFHTAELYVEISKNGGVTWTISSQNYIDGQHGNGWFQITLDLTNFESTDFTGNNTYVRFKTISDYGSYNIAIDDILGPNPYTLTPCTSYTIPYYNDFEINSDCWTAEDSNSDSIGWSIGAFSNAGCSTNDVVLYAPYSSTVDMDDWLFTPALELSAGINYSLDFSYSNDGGTTYKENMDVYLCDNNNSTSGLSGTLLLSKTNIEGACQNYFKNTITVDVSGTYHIAFYGKSTAYQDILIIDDFSLQETPFCTAITTWNGNNWSNSKPTNGATIAIINGNYDTSIEGDFFACSLQVNSNFTLSVTNSHIIKVTNNVTNFGSIIINKGGSFVQIDDNATVTSTGADSNFSTSVDTSPMADARYTYFSSPSQTATMNVFNSWAQMNRNYKFNGTTQDWVTTGSTELMSPGIGYIVRPLSDGYGVLTNPAPSPATETSFTTIFDGAFNNGIFTIPLFYNVAGTSDPTDNSSTLVGNPYPSGINPLTLLNVNTNVNALHFWTHNTGGNWQGEAYVTKNKAGYTGASSETISIGQGFFVDSNTSGSITFNNSMRVADTGTFNRPPISNLDKIWLNIESNNQIGAQILVGFNSICSDGFDPQYDARSFNGFSTLDFYSFGIGSNTSNLIIQTRNELNNNNTIIPLGFKLLDSSITNLTISIDHFENLNNSDIYLIDHNTNITHDLKISSYNFAINDYNTPIDNRFEIVFSRNTLSINNNILSSDDLIISNLNSNEIKVNMKNSSTITNFKAYDIVGKLILDLQPNKADFNIDTRINQGTVLFVKATLENGQVLSKKFIKL